MIFADIQASELYFSGKTFVGIGPDIEGWRFDKDPPITFQGRLLTAVPISINFSETLISPLMTHSSSLTLVRLLENNNL